MTDDREDRVRRVAGGAPSPYIVLGIISQMSNTPTFSNSGMTASAHPAHIAEKPVGPAYQ